MDDEPADKERADHGNQARERTGQRAIDEVREETAVDRVP